jgi:hypothetical protein
VTEEVTQRARGQWSAGACRMRRREPNGGHARRRHRGWSTIECGGGGEGSTEVEEEARQTRVHFFHAKKGMDKY